MSERESKRQRESVQRDGDSPVRRWQRLCASARVFVRARDDDDDDEEDSP